MNSKLQPWIPMIITVVGTLAAALVPVAQAYVAAHPQLAVIVAGVWAAYKGVSRSPLLPQ